jgi:hypothetical protein
MSAAPELKPRELPPTSPAPPRRERHLRLVPHRHGTGEPTPREVRQTRWVTALVAVITFAVFGLWTAAMFGAADAAWWPALLTVVFAAVVALGVVVVRRSG